MAETDDAQQHDGLVISRVCEAPRDVVFREWTDPERTRRWWGPKGFTTPHCSIDLRPGGAFRYCMRSPDGKEYWGVGVYQEVDAPERLVYRDFFSDEEGNPIEPVDYGMSPEFPAEAQVTVMFEEDAAGTEVTVHHDIPQSVPERSACWQGWSEMLERLAEEVRKRELK